MADKIKTFRELNLADDFLFGKVMSDTEICRKILEKILNIPIKKVEFPVTRKTTDTAPDDRGIRLDACINDEQGTIYSIEMQCGGKGELFRKSRSFQCNIDSDVISCGESCTKLKKSYIIFICTFDPFSDGRHIYTFENRCLEDLSLVLGDETTEIFLSTRGDKDDLDTEMKEFLTYIENSTDACAQQASSPLVREIHKRVAEVKLNKDMEIQYMALLQRGMENPEQGHEHGGI
jgi:predicted transposase/invertase (TIGR01784 family)